MRITTRLLGFSALLLGLSRAAGTEPQGTFEVVRDLTYLEPTRAEKLDLYLPRRAPGDRPSPAVVWVHGNGGTKDSDYLREECRVLVEAGYACAAIDWTLDTPFRVLPILDCKNAVRFLRTHASQYHIDPSRIAIGGSSGGGYLASMVGFTEGEAGFEPPGPYPGVPSAVSAVVDFYGGYDAMRYPLVRKQLQALPLGMAGVRPALAQIALFQPMNHLKRTAPPVLIVQGKDDPLIEYHQAIYMDEDLASMGVPHELVLLEHVGHSMTFTSWDDKPLPRDLRPVILEFLQEYLGTADHPAHGGRHAH